MSICFVRHVLRSIYRNLSLIIFHLCSNLSASVSHSQNKSCLILPLYFFCQVHVRTSEFKYTTRAFQTITDYLHKMITFLLRVIKTHSNCLDAYTLLGKFFPLQMSQFQSSSESEYYLSEDRFLKFAVSKLGIKRVNDSYYTGLYLQLLFVATLKEENFLESVHSRLNSWSSDDPQSLTPTTSQMKGLLKTLRTVSSPHFHLFFKSISL